ncbi:MAG TPA: SET domain-containing protein [Humisphaera sp.]|jgi:SET domain-containing protein|nr:SET domain-containing protein [Humisphaera sp.]
MYTKTHIAPSKIFGQGLFASEPIPRGKIVCFFCINAQIIDEQRFLQAVANNEQPMVRTATRQAGRYYTHGNENELYTFINHSFTPNLLCHVGMVIARRDIAAGEELTLDYRTLIDNSDIGVYRDAVSGEEIRGFSAQETLLRTARELLEIVGDLEGWEG